MRNMIAITTGEKTEAVEIIDMKETSYSRGIILDLDNGEEWYLFPSRDAAGEEAAENWREMAKHDAESLAEMVGLSVLVNWALGKADGPGQDKTAKSLDEWICNVVAEHPEEELGRYNGKEVPASGWKWSRAAQGAIAEEIGDWNIENAVLYRSN